MHKENKSGHSALDVARNWGDDFIYAIVYAKAQTLPPVVKKGIINHFLYRTALTIYIALDFVTRFLSCSHNQEGPLYQKSVN